MSRPIKFRVWNGVMMIYPTNVAIYCHQPDSFGWWSNETASGGSVPIPDRGVLMQFTGLKDSTGREIYENDIISWISASTPIPHSTSDNRMPQRYSYLGAVTWGIVEDDEYGNDVLGWTLDGTQLYTQEDRADLRAPFKAYSLYAVISRHSKDHSYPDSSWQMSLTACKVVGNICQHPTLLNA